MTQPYVTIDTENEDITINRERVLITVIQINKDNVISIPLPTSNIFKKFSYFPQIL